MTQVQCRICGTSVTTAYWAKLGLSDDQQGWMCKTCYAKFWGTWYRSPA